MIFEETVLPQGTKIYKGLRVRGLLRDTRLFFVTTNPRIAKIYGHVSLYQAKRPLRLFQMTPKNLLLLIEKYPGISVQTRTLLRFALGIGTTRAQQAEAYKYLYGKNLPVGSGNKRLGQRLSIYEIDRYLSERLVNEFLRPERYDGYYASRKQSIFYEKGFHSEIMLCDATKTLERVITKKVSKPLIDQRTLIQRLPELFVMYCKTHRRLLRMYGGFVLYLGGGMAVKLYLEARGITAPAKVRNTKDFDFTFAVHKKLSGRAISLRIYAMRQVMSRHLAGFIAWLNREYRFTGAKLVVKQFIPPGRILPATRKQVYQVISYQIQFPGMKEPMDFVDTSLAYIPKITREFIHPKYSRYYGIPLERLGHMYKNVLVVLAGSFVYPGIRLRNPLYGKYPEKGQKNVARLETLIRLRKKNTTVQNFIKKIQNKNIQGARRRARQIIGAIKRSK